MREREREGGRREGGRERERCLNIPPRSGFCSFKCHFTFNAATRIIYLTTRRRNVKTFLAPRLFFPSSRQLSSLSLFTTNTSAALRTDSHRAACSECPTARFVHGQPYGGRNENTAVNLLKKRSPKGALGPPEATECRMLSFIIVIIVRYMLGL